MEELGDIEWSTQIVEDYISQVEDLGERVRGILNQKGDVSVPQLVALPTKLVQITGHHTSIVPEGWVSKVKRALLKLLEQRRVDGNPTMEI